MESGEDIMGAEEKITFSFGQNWIDFLDTVDEEAVKSAAGDIIKRLEGAGIKVKDNTVLDIGCGSGIHSLAFYLMGAKRIFSFDYDPLSVEAAKRLWEKYNRPGNWQITRGDVLDGEFLNSLNKSGIVYSWGCLHHTGDMWKALNNVRGLIDDGGCWFLSLYQNVKTYKRDLFIKRTYNRMPKAGKKLMLGMYIMRVMAKRALRRQNPFKWNFQKDRGMNVYHDIVDWFGGLPYETASPEQIKEFGSENGFLLKGFDDREPCCVYIFQKNKL